MAEPDALATGRRRTHERSALVHDRAAQAHRRSAARFAKLNHEEEAAAELVSALLEDERAALERARAADIGR